MWFSAVNKTEDGCKRETLPSTVREDITPHIFFLAELQNPQEYLGSRLENKDKLR